MYGVQRGIVLISSDVLLRNSLERSLAQQGYLVYGAATHAEAEILLSATDGQIRIAIVPDGGSHQLGHGIRVLSLSREMAEMVRRSGNVPAEFVTAVQEALG
jgi:hypothetical protein